MSLRHILNDEPAEPLPPPAHSLPASATISHPDPASMRHSPPPLMPASAQRTRRKQQTRSSSSPPPQELSQPPSRPFTFQPSAYQGTGGWDPYTGDSVRGDIFPLGAGGNHHPEYDDQGPDSARMSNGESVPKEPVAESNGRKKRRTAASAASLDDDHDSQSATGKRRGTRRNPPRGKNDARLQPISQGVASIEPHHELTIVEEFRPQEPAQDDRRATSSDLEDCPEIWQGELGNYVLETHKRMRQIDAYFNRWIINRDSSTAYHVSHAYVERIARIPLPPPPPLPAHPAISSSVEDDFTRPGSPSANSADGFETIDYSFSRGAHDSAADAARELEEDLLGTSSKSNRKRPAPASVSDDSSEIDVPIAARHGPLSKKRKLAKAPAPEGAMEQNHSFIGNDALSSAKLSGPLKTVISAARGRGKGKQREDSVDSATATPKGRKRTLKKKDGFPLHAQEVLAAGSASAPISRDISPIASRAPSPALTHVSATIYELDEAIPSLKKAKRIDDAGMWKRVKSLEEAQRKVWTNIARRDIVKVYRYQSAGYQSRQQQLKRVATMSSLQARRPFTRSAKSTKDVQAKGKRLMREMLVFWKKNEKEERDVRRREQKEAVDRAKVEEEKREAARQARKLEFLISQTELYSHFVGNKLKTTEIQGDDTSENVPAGATIEDGDPHEALQDINFDDEDQTNIHRHARRNAQEAIALARRKAQEFDVQAALERKTNEALKLAKGQAHIRDNDEKPSTSTSSATPLVDLDSDELNFQNPTSLTGELTIKQPNMLMATLKEYQLKGLNWLGTLYEQGINGILADEMGLGKTVQSISLLAYLAEKHDIWGPFLVVSPASTLHNWQQEITRFVPKLKALPYWGNVKDRATLRKFWSKKEISYNEDAPFHVLITSYQLVTQDQQYFQRVKWQYMILDEAQNIKNSSSARWKTLLGFQCRNRLLLTGTPIQNSMQELWALLHFIMPSLFDSHDEFNEWFSKDIENAAENKGSRLNEHQLRRLHMILKPFMLRRVKRHVQNELSDKIEVDIYVDLSARQRKLYKALLANVSVADLLEKAANLTDADSARSLMNLVMQFRKVCNHPELFERADVVAPFSFSTFGKPGSLKGEGDSVHLPYSTRNPIQYEIPNLLYKDGGLVDVPQEDSRLCATRGPLATLYNIWSTDWIQRSLEEAHSSSFAFLRFLDMTPSEAHSIHFSPLLQRHLHGLYDEQQADPGKAYDSDPAFVATVRVSMYAVNHPSIEVCDKAEGYPSLDAISASAWTDSCLSRSSFHWYIPAVVAPPISIYCADRNFLEHETGILQAPYESLALYGLPSEYREFEDACSTFEQRMPGVPITGLINSSSKDQLPTPPMHVPEAKRLIYDSAKLARLDSLLHELKAGDHKVLVYFQMTRMMDLMEEYLIYRQYKYLRLDGSSKLEDRRDMVMEWQTRPDIFVFLLSTRAGGLGINLTAADTVIFYDHDWNPSNDAQAMDRAHRLGQTRQVTVYRLITKGTIDERIVQLARVKKDVQDIVVGNKNFTDVTKPSEIVQLLLNADQIANLDNNNAAAEKANGKRPAVPSDTDAAVRELWNEEGDEFFGHAGPSNSGGASIQELEDEGTPVPTTGRRKRGEPGARRGRKPGPKPGRKRGGGNPDTEP